MYIAHTTTWLVSFCLKYMFILTTYLLDSRRLEIDLIPACNIQDTHMTSIQVLRN